MSTSLRFVRHPGHVYPIGSSNFWVDPKNGYYLYRVQDNEPLKNIFGDTGYVISKTYTTMYKDVTSGAIFRFLGEFLIYPPYVWSDGSRYLYGNRIDTSFIMPIVNYSGPQRYIGNRYVHTINFGEKVEFIETEDPTKNDEDEPFVPKKIEIELMFPCWYSNTLLGEYTPFGGASGNIRVGTPSTKDDGTEELIIGNKWDLVYVGSLPVWH